MIDNLSKFTVFFIRFHVKINLTENISIRKFKYGFSSRLYTKWFIECTNVTIETSTFDATRRELELLEFDYRCNEYRSQCAPIRLQDFKSIKHLSWSIKFPYFWNKFLILKLIKNGWLERFWKVCRKKLIFSIIIRIWLQEKSLSKKF